MLPPGPIALALHIHDLTAVFVLLVGVIALGLAAVGQKAYVRSRNRALLFVTLAFVILGVKGLAGAWAIRTRAVAHEDLELALSIADLAIVLLLAAPFIIIRRGKLR